MHVAVVGSGPAAVACSHALLRRGLRVTMLDVGDNLDAPTQQVVDRMRDQPVSAWDAGDVATITNNPTLGRRPIPRRLAFGSGYIYGLDRDFAPLEQHGVSIAPTYARGGYSSVWGASLMPVHQDDIRDWPFARAALEPYYKQVLDGLPYSARDDGLSAEFPVFAGAVDPLHVSKQVAAFSADLNAGASNFGGDTMLHGQSRLAVRARDGARGLGCVYCGLCLSGCVKGAIHSTNDDLGRLIASGRIEYLGGRVVVRVEDHETGARVTCVEKRGGTRQTFRFDRIFVAAGAINSTRILMLSRQLFDETLSLRHSAKFVLPILRLPATPVEWPNLNTLAGMVLEFRLRGISAHWLHTQISAINDMVLTSLRARVGGAWTARGYLAMPLLRRLMVAWCGLHSDEAEPISVRLRRPIGAAAAVLELSAGDDPRLEATIRRAAWRLARHGLAFRSLFLAPFRVIGMTGDGNHHGGTLPMRASPRLPNETDLLGRPAGWSKVHFVDASVLPSIPATTLALTIMANARRIGDTAQFD